MMSPVYRYNKEDIGMMYVFDIAFGHTGMMVEYLTHTYTHKNIIYRCLQDDKKRKKYA